ncbi:VanZ family protein [Clostridioides sp. ES-S-0054-01]|uniref:VanZ family protein n=1 Tax=unclassified Clostridioides TaxID=2635829 RepID=UPI0037C09ADC
MSFLLNIFLFIPLGFLCPMISRIYERAQNAILLGTGLSLFIEIIQLFTLYRASNVNDLLTNVLGTIIGYLCFRLIVKLKIVKSNYNQDSKMNDLSQYLPFAIMAVTFVIEFFRPHIV